VGGVETEFWALHKSLPLLAFGAASRSVLGKVQFRELAIAERRDRQESSIWFRDG